MRDIAQPPELSDSHRPFSSFSCEGLERYFNALVDARNAIALRKSALEVDIGDYLKVLDARLSLYAKDEVFLQSAANEVQLIEQESSARDLRINFLRLELLRSLTRNPSYGSSFLEKESVIFSSTMRILRKRGDAGQITLLFLADPHSLAERRLPLLGNLQK